ncbi:MAG TPA: tRNA threonylcarbamoyladenosine dehydratase [Candidatus Pygmaiobacter gallistercoris]|nr:tRNA threonylcarbamoyladenosine dehydratase [Candidatus Pygmaiobacter gallistercoris]
MQELYARSARLLGPDAPALLAGARAAVFGIGGVGGHAAEALARAGVGALDLFDPDTVSPTNLNRQIVALHSTIGRYKAEVMAERVRDINPACAVRGLTVFYGPDNAGDYPLDQYDCVIDAVDTVSAKLELISRAVAAGVPVISAMGCGNKLDPSRFTVAPIEQTSICPLARIMRRELRARGIRGIKVVYSTEPPITPAPDGEDPAPGRHTVPGSVSWVPGAAGLLLAGEAVKEILTRAAGR